MIRVLVAAVLLLFCPACASTPEPQEESTRHGVISADDVDAWVSRVPVFPLQRLPEMGVGNAVFLGDNRVIAPAHCTLGDDRLYSINGQLTAIRTDHYGGGQMFHGDWRIATVESLDLSKYEALPVTRDVEIGDEVFLVGYWVEPENRADYDNRRLVVVRGEIVDPSSLLTFEDEDVIYADFSQVHPYWSGLSGAAAIVVTAEGPKLLGIYGGGRRVTLLPFINSSVIIPIPNY